MKKTKWTAGFYRVYHELLRLDVDLDKLKVVGLKLGHYISCRKIRVLYVDLIVRGNNWSELSGGRYN